jgi:pantoate--beta-alanine ligase
MKIIQSPAELREWRQNLPPEASLGFVPTMGALHQGHLSLVQAARAQSQLVIVSIFVNPTQFDRADDLNNYPRQLQQDLTLLQEAGCDAIFFPQVADVYPWGTGRLHINLPGLSDAWEGVSRPGHFAGVALVVSKLLMLVQPQRLFMGQKDFQQTVVIRTLLQELFIPVELCILPTLREADGLAMSSRNVRLDAPARALAPGLYRCLQAMQTDWHTGMTPADIRQRAMDALLAIPGCKPDYVALTHAHTLQSLEQRPDDADTPVVALLAAWLGGVRLIDCLVIQ